MTRPGRRSRQNKTKGATGVHVRNNTPRSVQRNPTQNHVPFGTGPRPYQAVPGYFERSFHPNLRFMRKFQTLTNMIEMKFARYTFTFSK